MAIISQPFTLTNGTVAQATDVNSDFTTIYADYNGNITNANISASAAIVDSKLAQITTSGKVSGTAITGLTNLPTGAGVVPLANIPTIDANTGISGILPVVHGGVGSDLSAAAKGDVVIFSSAGTMGVIAAGTSGQFLMSTGANLPPAYANQTLTKFVSPWFFARANSSYPSQVHGLGTDKMIVQVFIVDDTSSYARMQPVSPNVSVGNCGTNVWGISTTSYTITTSSSHMTTDGGAGFAFIDSGFLRSVAISCA